MRKTLLLLTIVLAACSGSSSEGPLLTFADFNSPPTTPEALAGSLTTTLPPPSTTTSSTSTTLLVIDTPSPVAIVSETGFSVLEGRGSPRRLVDTPVEAAFDDLQGGFVFQLPGAGIDPAADQRIFWSRATSPDAQPRLDVIDGSLLKLWGTEVIDGRPHLILTIVDDPDDPAKRVERLAVYDFEAGDRVLGEVGATESGPISVSYGGGRFLLQQRSGIQLFFEFRNDQGAVIDLASNPQPGCTEDDPTCPTHPALGPLGSFVAFVQPGPGEMRELIVYDLDLAEEVKRISLPEAVGEVESLDFDGETVLVNRVAPDGTRRAVIVDAASGTVGEFGLAGRVQFLREGPGFEGPIKILS